MIGLEILEFFAYATRPVNRDTRDGRVATDTEVQPLAGLRKEALAGPQRLNPPWFFLRCRGSDHNAGSDRVPIGRRAVPLESNRKEVVAGSCRRVVAHEPYAGRIAVGDPGVEITVLIPIDDGDRAGVVGKIESGNGRHRGKPLAPRIEEAAVSFVATERSAPLIISARSLRASSQASLVWACSLSGDCDTTCRQKKLHKSPVSSAVM